MFSQVITVWRAQRSLYLNLPNCVCLKKA
uniref:Uncharacterized protein n=1 Tax=Anguilla anguilla TaxID=7936 RepID=A0A0E9SUX3_ANGAN